MVTGLDVARSAGVRVVVGEDADSNCFAWRERVIVLSPSVAHGTDLHSLVVAAEEAAHARQPRWMHALRFFQPVRWLVEADAFLRVKRWLRECA